MFCQIFFSIFLLTNIFFYGMFSENGEEMEEKFKQGGKILALLCIYELVWCVKIEQLISPRKCRSCRSFRTDGKHRLYCVYDKNKEQDGDEDAFY